MVRFIPHIVRDSFDLLERIDSETVDDVCLGTCDIKSLYTNISHDLALFSKAFLLNALKLIYNFYLSLLLFQECKKFFGKV